MTNKKWDNPLGLDFPIEPGPITELAEKIQKILSSDGRKSKARNEADSNYFSAIQIILEKRIEQVKTARNVFSSFKHILHKKRTCLLSSADEREFLKATHQQEVQKFNRNWAKARSLIEIPDYGEYTLNQLKLDYLKDLIQGSEETNLSHPKDIIYWKSTTASLVTLFFDLIENNYIDVKTSKASIKRFILTHFRVRGKKLNVNTIDHYLNKNLGKVKAKRERVNLDNLGKKKS